MITIKRNQHPAPDAAGDAEERDLIARGFTSLKDEATPFDAPQWHRGKSQLTKEQKAGLQPFTSWYATRDYRKMYRVVFGFHKRHNPPPAAGSPRTDEYWAEVSADLQKIIEDNDGDPFLTDLLAAVFAELERESKFE